MIFDQTKYFFKIRVNFPFPFGLLVKTVQGDKIFSGEPISFGGFIASVVRTSPHFKNLSRLKQAQQKLKGSYFFQGGWGGGGGAYVITKFVGARALFEAKNPR